MNYKVFLLKELDNYIAIEYGIGYLNNTAINLCRNYLELRFENNLKQYNNDNSKAYDLFSAKKALEYLNIYAEEFYFLDKIKTHENFYIRSQIRSIILMLHDKINKSIREVINHVKIH